MEKRRNKFKEILTKCNVDALLIKSKANKMYIGALSGSGVKVLITKDNIYQLMDGRYINEAKANTCGFENIVFDQGSNYLEAVKQIVNDKIVAVEGNQVLAQEYLQMQQLGLNIVLLNNELSYARRCKDEQEIALVKKACEITDEIYAEVLEKIHVGMKETEVAAWIQFLALQKGASGMAFDTIVASGIRGALPHGRPTEKALAEHELVTIDFGIVYKGYQSDMTRTFALGEIDDRLRKIYDTVYLAQTKGVEFIKANVTGKQVDEYVRNIIKEAGYGEYFTHGLGHGMGMGDNELPLLNQRSETILEEGMIMSCEPGIYIEGVGGVRIEDDVVIIDGKGVALNKTPKELKIIEVK